MSRRAGRRAVTAAACALTAMLALVLTPARADAHAELLSTEPAAGEHLATAPDQVVLHFSEAVNLGDDLVRVLDSAGDEVDAGDPVHLNGERSSVALPLPSLDDGGYVVSWRVISSDGHPVGGAFTFRVGDASAAAPGEDQALIDDVLGGSGQGDTVLGVVYGVARFAAFAGVIVLIGAIAFVAWLWPAGRDDRRARRIGAVAWWTALVATLACIPLYAAYVVGGSLGDALDPSLIGDELGHQNGRAWLARALLLAVIAVVARSKRADRWLLSGLGAALLVTISLTGHAVSGDLVPLAFVTDLAHLGAVSVWLGGLVVLIGSLLWRESGSRRGDDEVATIVGRFSQVAFGAVVVIVVSGAIQGWRQVGSYDALFDTAYGRLLVTKVLLVAGMLVAASFSRAWIRNRAVAGARAMALSPGPGAVAASADRGPASLAVLRRSVAAEVALAVGVLAVTAMLVNAVPGAASGGDTGPRGPFATQVHGETLMVQVAVDPVTVGQSDVKLTVTDHGLNPIEPEEVQASLTLPERDLGPITLTLENTGPGVYVASDVEIPYPGEWQLDMAVRTSDIDQTLLKTAVPVS
ncbi:MAG TPA: copper resistance protein CopC [Acidimicrobiales bacterium]|nr:copper resistance protein CopC [Acidimicrobiales bacterium]